MPQENKDLDQTFAQPFPHFLDLLKTDPDAAVPEFTDLARRWLSAHPSPSMRRLPASEHEQIVEATIERCLRKEAEPLRNYTDHGVPFGEWLARVAEDTCAKTTHQHRQKPASEPTASDIPDERVLARIVWECVRDLKDADRRVALLGFGDGLKQSELIQLLGYRGKRDATAKMYAKLRSGKEELADLLKSLDYHREDAHTSEKTGSGTGTSDQDGLGWLDGWLARAARHTPDTKGFVRPLNDAIDEYLTGTADRNQQRQVQDALVKFRDFRQEVLERARILATTPASEVLERCDSIQDDLPENNTPGTSTAPENTTPENAASPERNAQEKATVPESPKTPRANQPAPKRVEPSNTTATSPKRHESHREPRRDAPGRRGVVAFSEWLRSPRVLAPIAAVAVLVAVISLQSRFGGGSLPGSKPAATYPDEITASFVTEADIAGSAYDPLPLPPLPATPGENSRSPSTIVFRSQRYVILHLEIGGPEGKPELSTFVIRNDAGESVWEETVPAESQDSGNLYFRLDPNSLPPGDYTIEVSNGDAAVVARSAFTIAV